VPPTFDVARFARDSDRRISAIERPPPASEQFPAEEADTRPETSSEVRLVTRPRWGQLITDEAWARSMLGTPVVVMEAECLKRLPLDHRAGFVLSLMDGSLDLETLIDLCGMERQDALSLIRNLFDSGVVDFR